MGDKAPKKDERFDWQDFYAYNASALSILLIPVVLACLVGIVCLLTGR